MILCDLIEQVMTLLGNGATFQKLRPIFIKGLRMAIWRWFQYFLLK